jgi:hypothetical protein
MHLVHQSTARSRQLVEHKGEEITVPSLIQPFLKPVSIGINES